MPLAPLRGLDRSDGARDAAGLRHAELVCRRRDRGRAAGARGDGARTYVGGTGSGQGGSPHAVPGVSMTLVLCLLCILLMPFAAAGLGLIQAGLGRSRSAAHALLTTVCALAVTSIVFVLLGFAGSGFAGGAALSFARGGVRWDWLGAEPVLARGVHFDGGPGAPNIPVGLVLCFEMFAVAIAAIIPNR